MNRYQTYGRRGKTTNVDDVGKMFPSSSQLENSANMYITMISTTSTTSATVNRIWIWCRVVHVDEE